MLVDLIDVVCLQHSHLLTEADKEFKEAAEAIFTAPQIVKDKTGYTLTAWVKLPSQMTPVVVYEYAKFEISASGEIVYTGSEGFNYNL